eukprot:5178205-Pyramimonas_sp.AAC.1
MPPRVCSLAVALQRQVALANLRILVDMSWWLHSLVRRVLRAWRPRPKSTPSPSADSTDDGLGILRGRVHDDGLRGNLEASRLQQLARMDDAINHMFLHGAAGSWHLLERITGPYSMAHSGMRQWYLLHAEVGQGLCEARPASQTLDR